MIWAATFKLRAQMLKKILSAYPEPFREQFGPQIEADLEEGLALTKRCWAFLLRSYFDLVVGEVRENQLAAVGCAVSFLACFCTGVLLGAAWSAHPYSIQSRTIVSEISLFAAFLGALWPLLGGALAWMMWAGICSFMLYTAKPGAAFDWTILFTSGVQTLVGWYFGRYFKTWSDRSFVALVLVTAAVGTSIGENAFLTKSPVVLGGACLIGGIAIAGIARTALRFWSAVFVLMVAAGIGAASGMGYPRWAGLVLTFQYLLVLVFVPLGSIVYLVGSRCVRKLSGAAAP